MIGKTPNKLAVDVLLSTMWALPSTAAHTAPRRNSSHRAKCAACRTEKNHTHTRNTLTSTVCESFFFLLLFYLLLLFFNHRQTVLNVRTSYSCTPHAVLSLSLSQIHARKKINRKLYVRTYERTWAKKSYDHVGRDHTLYRPPLSHTHTSTQTAHRHSHEQWVEKKTKSTDEWICSLLSVTFCRLHACQTTACSVDFFSTLFMILSHKRRTTIRHSVQSHTLRAMLYEY